MAAYKKKAIPEATRRAVALRYGCQPGQQLSGVKCHWCPTTGTIYWHRLAGGKPSMWVQFPGLELDHVIPERLGGSSDPDNIVLACQPCNRSRGSRLPHDMLTEDVVSGSRHPHLRKGREGKGVRKGEDPGVSPHPSSPSTPARSASIGSFQRPDSATMDGRYAAMIGGGRA